MAKKPPTLINVNSDDWLPHSSLFTDSHSRGFISESGIVFGFVQRDPKHQDLLNPSQMSKASRQYRSVIHSWYLKTLSSMSDDGDITVTAEEREQLQEQSQMLHKMEIAWHLCEILYINVPSLGTLFVPLLDWIKWHFTHYVELAEQIIVNDPPEMHPNYWDVVMYYSLCGDTENAALFLELHPESRTDQAFGVVKELLKKFPVVSHAVHEYGLRWEFWRENVRHVIAQKTVPAGPKKSHVQLSLLLQLLSGSDDAFRKVRHLFSSWYQMFVSYLLFTNPCLKKDLDGYLEEFIRTFYPNEPMSPFDRLIQSAFTFDLIEVIKQSSMCFDDAWWFVTHFVDLIHNSSRYSEYKIAEMAFIRDSFVISYAETLFAKRKQFWQLGVEYLAHCKDSEQHILACLERVPFENDRELQRLLTAARRFNFSELEYSLCRIRSRQWLEVAARKGYEQKYGSALFWAIRSRDKMLINHIVDQFLKNYLQKIKNFDNNEKIEMKNSKTKPLRPRLLDEDILSNIGGSIVLSERLIFLCKYHEFNELCDSNRLRDATKIIVEMLTSGAVPEFFWLQVLRDCLPLLEKSAAPITNTENLFVDGQQTIKIIAALEKILTRIKQKNEHKNTVNRELWAEYFIRNCKSSMANNNDLEKSGTKKKRDHDGDADDEQRNEDNDEQLSLELERLEVLEKKLRVAAAHNLARNFVRADECFLF